MKKRRFISLFLAIMMCLTCILPSVDSVEAAYDYIDDTYYLEEGETVDLYPLPRLSGGTRNFFRLPDAETVGYAYCCENNKASWERYEPMACPIEEWDNHLVRKAIYYGPGSPGYKPSGNGEGYDADSVTFTVGYLNNMTANESRALEYIARIKDLPDPYYMGYRAFKAITRAELQNVAFLTYFNGYGELYINKISTNPEIKDIDLEYNAPTFGIYSDKECTNLISTYTEYDFSVGEGVKLWEGTYYVKEIIAPDGFILNEKVFKVTMVKGKGTSLTVPNTPEDVGKGKLQVKKVSSNPSLTNDSECYSFLGLKIGVYSDEDCTQLVNALDIPEDDADFYRDPETNEYVSGYVTRDENYNEVGYTDVIKLGFGTYYLKEIEAPKGYVLSEEVKKVEIKEGVTETLVVEFSNDPLVVEFDPYTILLKKINAFGEINPEGMLSLEGAVFRLKFYEGLTYETSGLQVEEDWYDEEGNVKYLPSREPDRYWDLKTNKNGYCQLSEDCKVDGSDFYISPSGLPSLPVGLLVIQEIKAPDGYKIYEKPFIVEIKSDSEDDGLIVYNEPTVPELPNSTLKISKKNIDKYTVVRGSAEFTHIKPDGTKEVINTECVSLGYDDVGDEIFENYGIISNLDEGKHIIYESKPPKGYDINPSKIEFTYTYKDGIVFTNKDSLGNTVDISSEGLLFMEETNSFEKVDEVVVYDEFKYDLVINKSDSISGELLDGAEFTLYEDEELTVEFGKAVTKDGTLKFEGLKMDKDYYLVETRNPEGYSSPIISETGEQFIYVINSGNTGYDIYSKAFETIIYDIFNEYYIYVDSVYGVIDDCGPLGSIKDVSVSKDWVVTLDITNDKMIDLPDTGSSLKIILSLSGIALIVISVLYRKKHKNMVDEGGNSNE